MKRLFRELGYFLAVFFFVSIFFGFGQFAYDRWPAELFVGLAVAVMYSIYRFAYWLAGRTGDLQ